jgi:hypothetical protein
MVGGGDVMSGGEEEGETNVSLKASSQSSSVACVRKFGAAGIGGSVSPAGWCHWYELWLLHIG